jgi:hypothetical protein
MDMCVSSVMNLESMPAIALWTGGDLQVDLENRDDTSSVIREILQQSPFSTAC